MRMNVNQTAIAFGVSTMSIWNWRQGSVAREPLPVVTENQHFSRPQVFVEVKAAKAWARKYGIPFTIPNKEDLVVGKAGPKPRMRKPELKGSESRIGARLRKRLETRRQAH